MRIGLALAGSVASAVAMTALLVLLVSQSKSKDTELLSRHKSYYYNVFGKPDQFQLALSQRKQESRNALALHNLNARETSLAVMPSQMSRGALENRVSALEGDVSELMEDLKAQNQKVKSTCPLNVPVCAAANKCTKCPLQCGGLCQSLSSESCGMNSCVTCPVGMKLSADTGSSTGTCEPCLHQWYDSSTGKITDAACNGGSYLSHKGTFELASSCALDSFGKASCTWTNTGKMHQQKAAETHAAKKIQPKDVYSLRMQWAKQALHSIQKSKKPLFATSKLATAMPVKPVRTVTTTPNDGDVDAIRTSLEYRHSTSEGSPWFRTQHNGDMGYMLTTESNDDNPVALLKPGDYFKDPYERKFLKAPEPHDPASTLANTVTGDYASPATWGNIYRDKETLDWCTEQFDWFDDRIKCISTLHASGPTLN